MMVCSHRSIPVLLAGLTLATLTACGPKIRFSDSVDTQFDLRWSHRYDDRLHGPYVAGASFRIYVYDVTDEHDLDGWRVVSRNPEVLDIVEQYVEQDDLDEDDKSNDESDVIVSQVYAAGEGTAILEVYDDNDDFVRATEVEVMQPDRIVLRAAGPLFVEREDVVPSLVDDTPKLLSGGTATFLVEWYKGEQRLHGAGALGLGSDHEAIHELWPRTSYFDEDRDWATITMAPGLTAADSVVTPIEFSANGLPVATFDFSVVGPDAITSIELHGEREGDAEDGQLLVVLAQGFDDADESVWGIGFDWDLDGRDEPGEGDLFRYWFSRGDWNTLGAEFNGLRSEAEIQGVEGFVDSSNDISCFCSIDEERPERGVALGLLGLAMLGLVRRRRS